MVERWAETMRRHRAGEDLDALIDEFDQVERAEFDRYLRVELGRPDLADNHARKMRDIDLGTYGARATWAALSKVQRSTLVAVSKTRSGKIVRRTVKPSVYVLNGEAGLLCRVRTLRNLCDRELLAWDGGAFHPEQAAVVTERGRFVVEHGPHPDRAAAAAGGGRG